MFANLCLLFLPRQVLSGWTDGPRHHRQPNHTNQAHPSVTHPPPALPSTLKKPRERPAILSSPRVLLEFVSAVISWSQGTYFSKLGIATRVCLLPHSPPLYPSLTHSASKPRLNSASCPPLLVSRALIVMASPRGKARRFELQALARDSDARPPRQPPASRSIVPRKALSPSSPSGPPRTSPFSGCAYSLPPPESFTLGGDIAHA